MQEVTFMPDVMCTPLENDNTFKSQQVVFIGGKRSYFEIYDLII